jgi:hypothetical protein
MKNMNFFKRCVSLLLILVFTGLEDIEASSQLTQYLPYVLNNYEPCSDFFDDFSNPDSGWYATEDETAKWEYLDGEYRILTKDDYFEFYYATPPTCGSENYSVEVDSRWFGEPGYSYGILFGIVGDLDQYYIFDVNTDAQDYGLWYFNGSEYIVLVPFSESEYVNPGNGSNHLKATKYKDQITLEINGFLLGTWTDYFLTGITYTAIISSPYDGIPYSDARFDNFSLTTYHADQLEEDPIIILEGLNPSNYPEHDYVTLRSGMPIEVDFTGWWLKIENQNGRYNFPAKFSLEPGQTVNIRSGVGIDTPTDLYMDLSYSLWTVPTNCGYLRSKSGILVDKICVD